MICYECNLRNECDWFRYYQRVEEDIFCGIGTDSSVGQALAVTIEDNQLEECDYFEQEERNG